MKSLWKNNKNKKVFTRLQVVLVAALVVVVIILGILFGKMYAIGSQENDVSTKKHLNGEMLTGLKGDPNNIPEAENKENQTDNKDGSEVKNEKENVSQVSEKKDPFSSKFFTDNKVATQSNKRPQGSNNKPQNNSVKPNVNAGNNNSSNKDDDYIIGDNTLDKDFTYDMARKYAGEFYGKDSEALKSDFDDALYIGDRKYYEVTVRSKALQQVGSSYKTTFNVLVNSKKQVFDSDTYHRSKRLVKAKSHYDKVVDSIWKETMGNMGQLKPWGM